MNPFLHNPPIEYKGFQIHPRTFDIYRNRKHIFSAYWQQCLTLQEAKDTIDMSLEEKERRVKALPDLGYVAVQSEEYENGVEDADRFTNWIETEAERQMEENIL